jgi:hypothetical protein
MDIGTINLGLRSGNAQQYAGAYSQAAVYVLKAVQAIGEDDLDDASVNYMKACLEIWNSKLVYIVHYLVYIAIENMFLL